MNAINHAATSLLIKSKYPHVPIIPILVSVQLIEIFWVVLNIAGIEFTEFSSQVTSIADVHLVHMPFSHSIIFTVFWACLSYFVVTKLFKRPKWAIAVSLGVMSHLVLDIATHSFDIEIVPFLGLPEIGTGLYSVPLLAFLVELLYCVFIWRYIKGSYVTLAAFIVLNLFGLSFYVPQIQGPEGFLVNYPYMFAPVIGVHIIAGLVSIWFVYRYEFNLPNKNLN